MLKNSLYLLTAALSVQLTQAQLKWPGCDDLKNTDFKVTPLITGKAELMELEVAKDGRVFYTAKGGTVNIYDPALNTHVEIANVGADANGYMGLWGIALDPKFPAEPWIYLYYTPKLKTPNPPGVDPFSDFRLSRFKFVSGKIDLTSEKVLLEVPNDTTNQFPAGSHTGGKLRFDIQGNLYITTGDNRFWGEYPATNEVSLNHAPLATSANTNDLRGKILRIHPELNGTYTIPNGNLFPKTKAKTRPEIYSMGMRNPISLHIDPIHGWVLESEAGPDDNDKYAGGPLGYGGDEFQIFTAPGNGGWPMFFGKDYAYPHRDWTVTTPTFGAKFNPLKPVNDSRFNTGIDTLPPLTPATYVTLKRQATDIIGFGGGEMAALSGPIYRYDPTSASTVKFPPHFHGKWIISNHFQPILGVLTLDGAGKVIDSAPFLPGVTFPNGVMDLGFSPDGILYVMSHYSGTLTKLEYQGTCRSTVASAFAVKGCRNPAYSEFNPYADADSSGACITQVSTSIVSMKDFQPRADAAFGPLFTESGRHSVEVYTMSGTRVWTGELEAGAKMPEGFPTQAGMYWIKTVTSKGPILSRFTLLR